MNRIHTREGNLVVITMLCLILLVFVAAMFLDVGLIEISDKKSPATEDFSSVSHIDLNNAKANTKGQHLPVSDAVERPDRNFRKGQTVKNTGDGNAVRIALQALDRRTRATGSFGAGTYLNQVESIAASQPRDIVFVVDVSGSMNDDCESVWATKSIDAKFKNSEFAGVGEKLVQQFYSDMNFGSYPGELQYIGSPLGGIPKSSDAYNKMTMDGGKLSEDAIESQYRIETGDSEATRKIKAYKWMIDKQIALLMPEAKPTPDSETNYEFWEKYLDYIMVVKYVGTTKKKKKKKTTSGGGLESGRPSPGLGQNRLNSLPRYTSLLVRQPLAMLTPRMNERGWVPPNVDSDRIYKFNNPNKAAFSQCDAKTRWQLRNKIGYRTYSQFLMDWGRDGKPEGKTFVQSSVESPHCPYHEEVINGETFLFPPRTQPMNSVRRSLIAALQMIRNRNEEYGMTSQRDLVSVMTFDSLANGISIQQPLTDNYNAAMDQCRKLQATHDKGSSTATEIGLKHAYQYLRPVDEGGVGRIGAQKVVVLLTDGLPNACVSSKDAIDKFVEEHADEQEFYRNGRYWLDAAIMQCKIMQANDWYIYPVGIGFGTDYDFMDRVARIGSTAIDDEAMRGAGNPAQYEESLEAMFNEIIVNSSVSFVK